MTASSRPADTAFLLQQLKQRKEESQAELFGVLSGLLPVKEIVARIEKLKNQIDPLCRTPKGDSLLHHWLRYSATIQYNPDDRIAVFAALLRIPGLDINYENEKGETVLDVLLSYFVYKRAFDLPMFLMQNGAKLQKNLDDETVVKSFAEVKERIRIETPPNPLKVTDSKEYQTLSSEKQELLKGLVSSTVCMFLRSCINEKSEKTSNDIENLLLTAEMSKIEIELPKYFKGIASGRYRMAPFPEGYLARLSLITQYFYSSIKRPKIKLNKSEADAIVSEFERLKNLIAKPLETLDETMLRSQVRSYYNCLITSEDFIDKALQEKINSKITEWIKNFPLANHHEVFKTTFETLQASLKPERSVFFERSCKIIGMLIDCYSARGKSYTEENEISFKNTSCRI